MVNINPEKLAAGKRPHKKLPSKNIAISMHTAAASICP
jgi:hypothetical protein